MVKLVCSCVFFWWCFIFWVKDPNVHMKFSKHENLCLKCYFVHVKILKRAKVGTWFLKHESFL
jgi:hypothetical protein